jgi:hypothetical protein
MLDNPGVPESIDYDIHGLVGVRLINPSSSDVATVTKQLGPLQSPLSREPDIIVRFVQHLPMTGLRYVDLHKSGFTEDGFFILQSQKKAARVKIAFDQIGTQCEIVCESGLRAVPLLLAIVNLTVLKKDCVPLHASAFVHQGRGILVTGWAKGGKTEALLACSLHGAEYVGDEWILLRGDGQKMYGVPENIRLWTWHLEYLPHVRRQVKREELLLFKGIHCLDKVQQMLPHGKLGNLAPLKLWREAIPALRRQLNVVMAPEHIFGSRMESFEAEPDKVFLMMNHARPDIRVEPKDPMEIARHMAASIQYEQIPFMEHYMAFKFAFPERQNAFIEQAPAYQYDILTRALSGKEAYVVYHPYPVSFHGLYKAMQPFCETLADQTSLEKSTTNGTKCIEQLLSDPR